MKTTIKRFLLILPVMFCMVLGLAVPAVSSAAEYNYFTYSKWLQHLDIADPGDDYYIPIDLSLYSDNIFAIQFFEASSSTDIYCQSLVISFSDDKVSSDNSTSNLIDISFSSGVIVDRRQKISGNGHTSSTGYTLNRFTYDIENCVLTLYTTNGNTYSGICPQTLHYVYSNFAILDDSLNVSVVFQPELSGSVDRTITNGSGASGLSQGFNMTVSNNGRSGVQYRMAIFEGTSILAYPSGGIYSDTDNCIYAYLTKQWVMAADISTMRHIYAYETATKQFTSCNWHYLAAGATDEQFFKFSQINFKPNVEYTVIVEAVPNSGGTTSIYFTGNTLARGDGEHAMDSSFEQYILSNDDIEVVHRSTFTIPNLSDVTYNPDDSSNGLIPNSSHEDYARAINTRDAYEKEDGTIDYSSYNAYDDPNSWINDPKIKSSEEWYALGNTFYDDGVTSLSYSGSSFGSGFVPASVGSLGTGVANFGLFLTSVFGLLPPAFSSLLTIGLITIVIIGIIKAVK